MADSGPTQNEKKTALADEWRITVTSAEETPSTNNWSSSCAEWARSLCKNMRKVGVEDPRRIYHSIKVGIALAVVSLFYFMNPLFYSVGGTATWAVMTVVVVFEFTAGATLSKGLNRIAATILGGALAVATDFYTSLAPHDSQPFLLAIALFLLGAAATFLRFIPNLKKSYDYGMLIFILTFSFIAVSGYRDEKLFLTAFRRIATIIIGCVICLLISLVIFPVWAGDDLHSLILRNMEALAFSLHGCVRLYFGESLSNEETQKICSQYKCVLNSKANEESLANFAKWEPPHGNFRRRHPWKLYLKVGSLLRYCAYGVEALNSCLNSEIQTPNFLREQLKDPCLRISEKCSKTLIELCESTKTMTNFTEATLSSRIEALERSVEDLHACIISQPDLFVCNKERIPPKENAEKISSEESDKKTVSAKEKGADKSGVCLRDTLPLATVACLLTEITARLQTVIHAVSELAQHASFKNVR